MAFTIEGNPANPASERSLVALAQALTSANDPPSVAISGKVNVADNVAKELRVGPTNLLNRKRILIQAQGAGVLWGFSPTTCFTTMKADELVWVRVGPATTIWAIKVSGNANIAVTEFA